MVDHLIMLTQRNLRWRNGVSYIAMRRSVAHPWDSRKRYLGRFAAGATSAGT